MFFATSMLRTLMLALLAGFSLPLAAQTQTPHGGTPFLVPAQGAVIIEAENFDDGGQDVAYHDNVLGNAGTQYRTGEDVDIIVSTDSADAGSGFVVNNFETGEWLEYTVNIQTAGQYEIAIRAASNWTTNTPKFHVEIDGVNVTGNVDVQLTGSWSTFAWHVKRGVSLPAGQHVLRLVSDAQYFDVNKIRVTATPTTPFAGVISLPGMFEAENFDNGGQDVAYNDTTANNEGLQFRTGEGVDIITSRDPDDAGTGFSVNNFHAGEWMVYTVSVANPGLYDIEARVATGTFANAAIHIEIDGVNVTGSMMPGATGNFGAYTWVKKPGVQLSAGQHVLKLVSDQEIADVNRIRVSVTHTPYSGAPVNGNPIALPGTFEAEHFDEGGEGNAYHDLTATNDGGAPFRVSEGVDIKPDADGAGTLAINNFGTGEWVAYTVNVTTTGSYDIDLRASTGSFTNAAYHIEIDDVPVTGSIVLPSTGNFGTYAWIGKTTVQLTAGQHTLKLFSDQQFVDVNQIRVATATARQRPAELLFYSGFEGISLSPIVSDTQCDDVNCFQSLVGTDSVSGDAWPPQRIPATSGSRFKLRSGGGTQMTPDFFSKPKANTIANWIVNSIEPATGHKGTSTQVQASEIKQNCLGHTVGQEDCSTQDTYQGDTGATTSELPDMYISFWRKYQPELFDRLTAAGATSGDAADPWHVVFEWKTNGDRRVIAQIVKWESNQLPYFQISSDTTTSGAGELWRCPFFMHTTTPDPDCHAPVFRLPQSFFGGWYKFEVFWHRSTGSDGRVWMAVNGVTIVDRHGPNKATSLIDRIMFLQLYSGLAYPLKQWTDDVQIWTKVPVEGVDAIQGDPWFDKPYGVLPAQ